jgi:hypothetical protein
VAYLKRQHNIKTLIFSAKKIYGFWVNMCFLEVCDDALWMFIEQIWELTSTTLKALNAVR